MLFDGYLQGALNNNKSNHMPQTCVGSLLDIKNRMTVGYYSLGLDGLDWRNATRTARTPLSLSCVSSFFLPAAFLTRPLYISIGSSPLLYHVLLLQVLNKLPPLDTLHQNVFQISNKLVSEDFHNILQFNATQTHHPLAE